MRGDELWHAVVSQRVRGLAVAACVQPPGRHRADAQAEPGEPRRGSRRVAVAAVRPRMRHGARPYPAAGIGSRAMRLALPIVWSDRHRRHAPGRELWIGVRPPGTDVPPHRALIVAVGDDAAGGEPGAPLVVTPSGFRAAGSALRALGIPTVLFPEAGYDLTTIGALVCETLAGVQEGPARA
jgi:hypothetical protein